MGSFRSWFGAEDFVKVALVSHSVPPASGAQPALIYRLLRDADPESYCLISQGIDETQVGRSDSSMRLPGRYRFVPPETEIAPFKGGRGGRAVRALNIVPALAQRTRRLLSILRADECDVVVAMTGDLLNLPASFFASRFARIPFIAYLCDYYSQQWVNSEYRVTARVLEPIVLKRAEGAIVLNEFMRDSLARRFEIEPTLIRNPCDLSLYEGDGLGPRERDGDQAHIVYTGAVSPAQADALQNLIRAVELLDRGVAAVPHIYTGQSGETLAALGLRAGFVHHAHVPHQVVPSVQRQADILFLPLAFRSPYPEIVRTSAPFKLGEYLASRRPILVHAPADSFLAWYFRRHDCGFVVTEDAPEKLAEAIGRLTADQPLQSELVERAWQRAQTDFSVERARSDFFELAQQTIRERSRGPRRRRW